MYLNFFIYDMLPWHGGGARKRGERNTGYWSKTRMVPPLHLQLVAFLSPQPPTPPPVVIFPSRSNIFQRLLCKMDLDHSRRLEPIFCRNVSKWKSSNRGLGFRRSRIMFPLFQPGSCVTRVDGFTLTAWKDIMRKNHIKLTTEFTVKILSNKVSVSPL